MASFTIKTYSVKLTNCARPYAWIMLFDQADQFRARLNFYPMQESNTYALTQTGDFIQVELNYKTFDATVDILRNEGPLTFTWHTTTKVCIIATGDEIVGEEEPKTFPILTRISPP